MGSLASLCHGPDEKDQVAAGEEERRNGRVKYRGRRKLKLAEREREAAGLRNKSEGAK